MKAAESRAERSERPADGPSKRPLGPVLSFMRALWGVNHALGSTSRRMKTGIGVTGPQRMVVRLVGRYPGVSAGELARLLRVHPSTLTGLLRRLVDRGLLMRSADSHDARRALFTLTARGAVVDRMRRGTVEAAVTGALESLPEGDVRTAAAVLDAVAAAMDR